ncbi:MAG: DUF4167 domain-containing protein [Pseudomonadota bacterium]|nr:DUF4167 domain-containing protein [Pseudomonadota bacterium]
MRQGGPNNGRRPRGRHHGGGGGGGGGHHGGGGGNGNGNTGSNPALRDNRPRSAASLRHQTFDSNCTDVRVRGNAWQVHEKYQALARDAQSSGDRVAAENYLQHAEHYYRIIEAINEATAVEQRARGVPVTPGTPPTAFGQQPEVPNNYYGTPGNSAAQPAGNEPSGNTASAAPANSEAEVQKRAPASPFFAPEEMEDQNGNTGGNEPLAARR